MKQWIPFSLGQGTYSRQAHCDLPEGTFEREVGKEGFFGPATHFYHRHPPTSWTHIEGSIRPRAFDTNQLETGGSPWTAPVLLKNHHCQIRIWQCDSPMKQLARNADGDDLLFVHAGEGRLFCDYGHLSYRDGDYILLPRGTLWRLEPSAATRLLMIEATNSSYRLPDKGMLGPNAIFDPAVLDTPVIDDRFLEQQHDNETLVEVKRLDGISRITFPFNPLDAIGWKGNLSVVKVNWRDIRPVMSHRYHVPPSAHTTFLSDRFVVCTFCPRPIESDPGALKVPFFHSNDDFEEFIFYHRGEFFSRDNIHPGMTSYHPYGFTHGPHPGAFRKGAKHVNKETDEVAVMVDTRDALTVTESAQQCEWTGYAQSWQTSSTAK
ncbi:homogentisate 1,2-dioxygenase [Litorivivens sp.]|uniref:homogentisate 1,2-dioxygenase n=1 Tax=Litorivivens sp. TaxID=2020868 RepID=UPI003563130A